MFDRYYAPLCRFAEFWLRDRASAEEVVLDVYTHVWQHAAELRIAVSVRAYLFRAVRNRALNRLRDDRFSYIPFEELGEVFASPESLQIETDEITQLVAEAVSQLPGRCRDIFLNSRRNAYFRQDRRSADEPGAASPARSAPQGVTRRGCNE